MLLFLHFVEQLLLESTTEEDEEAPADWISFWKPNMTVNLVDDFTKYTFLHTRSLAIVFAANWHCFLFYWCWSTTCATFAFATNYSRRNVYFWLIGLR
jgi:hypothetical protein